MLRADGHLCDVHGCRVVLAVTHGTEMAYRKHGCRCEVCVMERKARDRQRYLSNLITPAVDNTVHATAPCGTPGAYQYYGCRCFHCRAWHRRDVSAWRKRKKDADASDKMARREARVVAIRAAMAHQQPLPTPTSPHAPLIARKPQSLAQGQQPPAAVGKSGGFRVSLTDEDCLRQRRK